jgi:hypothetical protein
MIKIGPGFISSLVYSLIKLWDVKRKIDDRNNDMILLCYLIIFIWASRSNINMIHTSYLYSTRKELHQVI